MSSVTIWAWRHPRPKQVAGYCVGRHDVALDRRKAKRLAHRIRRTARQHELPRIVHTSSLRRCRWVGEQLRQWGWCHIVDDRLLEADFGAWEGRKWSDIARDELDAWVANFTRYRPGGGECVSELLSRAAAWSPLTSDGRAQPPTSALVVTHGGWMLARRWTNEHARPPAAADEWPSAPAYGQCWQLR